MRQCTKCKEEKPLGSFDKNGLTSAGTQRYRANCRQCKSKADSQYAKQVKQGERVPRSVQKNPNRAKVQEYLAKNPCVDCGEADVVVLEFDHVRGTKLANVSRLIGLKKPWEIIEEEIAKCEVRCCNCHRRVTAKRGKWHSI